MTNALFSIRLREARQMMGLSMDKLVERTNGAITKQSISRYEKGIMRPKRDALQAIAKALNISEEYFEGTNLKIDMPMLRTTSNGKLSEDELQALEAKLSFWAEQYLTKEKEAGFPTRFKNPVKALKKVPNFKLHSLFLNFNSCPRSISSFKSGILFWTGI